MSELTSTSTRIITIGSAIREALAEEMRRDERVFVMGEDVAKFGGVFGATRGLLDEFGPKRIFDTPISEMFIVGGGVGAALTGLRPVVELQFADFIMNAADEIMAKMAKWRYMHGGRLTVPMVVRMPAGAMGGMGAEHSQCPEALLLQAPGIYIVIPSTPYDAKGLLKTSIRDDNPVCFFEHKGMYQTAGEVPADEYTIPLGVADVKRDGGDVSVICWGRMVQIALKAADEAARRDIDVEVLDLRCLRPLDVDSILRTVRKTGRLIICHEASKTGGAGAEIAAIVAEDALDALAAPIRRVCGPDAPIPQSQHLERLWLPDSEDLLTAIQEIVS
ncbi:pyruvate dehydrogenase E1 component beta subunit [Steroidobacter denitrificans]|uniref:2-oxoisovalerate dehydrogenase subunit beta n=1 Tax=Steroidobacter denitrificans TaxID=465721 RepID=A0A127F5Q3_STEDE|nr:alpha-ketoacid dehydrogenase subunit beta [Steroidobacter denitrificans]AMN45757.1 pyruvate dehydrogenase E1 component beta subunit [Steroidobacter denitrificans]